MALRSSAFDQLGLTLMHSAGRTEKLLSLETRGFFGAYQSWPGGILKNYSHWQLALARVAASTAEALEFEGLLGSSAQQSHTRSQKC